MLLVFWRGCAGSEEGWVLLLWAALMDDPGPPITHGIERKQSQQNDKASEKKQLSPGAPSLSQILLSRSKHVHVFSFLLFFFSIYLHVLK